MYNTHLVLPSDLGTFDVNLLSKFDHYLFVIVDSGSQFELAVKKIGPVLAACGSLCFLIDQESLKDVEGSAILGSLFGTAAELAPKQAVSFVAAISKKNLLSANPKGTWFELFLSLENSEDDRERKLRSVIQKALSEKPVDYSIYGPVIRKFAGWLATAILKAHG